MCKTKQYYYSITACHLLLSLIYDSECNHFLYYTCSYFILTGSKMMARLGDMEDVERKLSKYCSCTLARSTLRRFDPRFNNNISLERLCLPHCLQLEPLLSPDIPLRDRNIDMIRAAVRECSNPTVCS